MQPPGIAKYHVLDFATVRGASLGAEKLIAYVTGKGIRHNTGPRRAVIYGERADGAPEVQALLYVSAGALEAAREIRMLFTLKDELTYDKLPGSAILLHGQP
jgi:hypothetical protein